ncbi:DNA (cytosine-5)-methyltransferase 1 [Sphingomonas gellani]|uniref:Cytosine-specific methyltransferase n=1 Tax=Sphingomonas gellani TaxID=1166340 RepID=A0A1H7Z914_9SPHN|nr:DNA cytosine methyltransferase [Sphingomonas gellani]SEM54711.1 DNA (cytosine-5)-methyltransferase 1 [Sphingomonas gellani]
MRYLDVCAGISASTVAWKPLGWEASAYSEIEAAPRAILAHHYPDTPLHGDFTTIQGDEYGPIDLLVGGTPCQDFSVAGLRAGLDGDRGNLSLEFLRLADRTRPRWLVWENVPGVLSINGGRAFGAILGGLGQLGYGFAYRVLDAQFFGVPQRRRRVFVVGYLGDWRRAAAVLFERHSLSGHSAPRREAREGVADRAPFGPGESSSGAGRTANGRPPDQAFGGGANCHPTDVATAVAAHSGGRYDLDCETFVAEQAATLAAGGNVTGGNRYPGMSAETAGTMLVAHALRGEGFDASEDGTGRGTPLVPVPFDTTQITSAANYSNPKSGDPCHPLARGMHPPAVAFTASEQANSFAWERDIYPTLNAQIPNDSSNIQQGIRLGSAVRRLTPRECERLQGFPDDYTLAPHRGKPMADGPRYKALGNSMAVPVMRWIGERIAAVDALSAPGSIAA